MLSKAWDLVKSATVEGELLRPSEVSEMRDRLVRMRTKKEEKANVPRTSLPFNASRPTRESHRNGFTHWFAALREGYAAEAFYQDVLVKLTANGEATSLLEYEKMWTRHIIRHAADEVWPADPMSSQPLSRTALEGRIGNIDKKLIDTTTRRLCTNAIPAAEPALLEEFSANTIKLITQQDDPPADATAE